MFVTIDRMFLIHSVNTQVNRPTFSSIIRFYHAVSNRSIHEIDVSLNISNITYVKDELGFSLSHVMLWNDTDDIYITFDAGVLFSNATMNSTAAIDRQFWYLELIDTMNPTTQTITSTSRTSERISTMTMSSLTSDASTVSNTDHTQSMTTTLSTKVTMAKETTSSSTSKLNTKGIY
jgi:hypothetical protein